MSQTHQPPARAPDDLMSWGLAQQARTWRDQAWRDQANQRPAQSEPVLQGRVLPCQALQEPEERRPLQPGPAR